MLPQLVKIGWMLTEALSFCQLYAYEDYEDILLNVICVNLKISR